MTKKFFAAFLVAAVIFSFAAMPASASADKVRVREVNVNLPQVSVEIEGNVDESDVVSATLNGETLSLDSSASAANAEKSLVYILVDTSSKMKKAQSAINKLKPALSNFISSFGKDDKVVLITYNSEVNTPLLSGGESEKEIKKAVNSLKYDSKTSKSCFYKVLKSVMRETKNLKNYDRKYVVMISDGIDDDNSNNTYQKVIESYKTHDLPVYGLRPSYVSKSNYGKFSNICSKSGGSLQSFNKSNAVSRFNFMKGKINNNTILSFESSKKTTAGSSKLVLKMDSGITAVQKVRVVAQQDNTLPSVKKIEFDTETNSFIIKFSEEVENADSSDSYTITASDGSEVTFDTPTYENKTAVIHAKSTVYSGTYNFAFNSIVDATDDKNPLSDDELSQEISASSFAVNVLIIIGIALIPIAFLVALYLILLNLKKKKNVKRIRDIFISQEEEVKEEHVHINSPQGLKLKMFIYGRNGDTHTAEYNLLSSMIVGRSDICDVAIDDDNLSRQHFVIEQVETGIAVTDLSTTNGTSVNGVPIHSRTYLNSGDKITAGFTTITVIY